jgi:SAM-dependent methyltransferase
MSYDEELRRHNDVLRRACGIRVGERVLDVGCGSGRTTREAGWAAGSAFGVDVSDAAVERAREIARAEGLRNVTFERADAQVHPFPPEQFDLVISRFGTMFFDDPVAAFGNIRRALRPGGRLVMLVWQAGDRNEWNVAIHQALAGQGESTAENPPGLDPFTLADPATVERILTAAGFADIDFADVREPVFYGADVAAALAWVRFFTCTNNALSRLDAAGVELAIERLREMFAAHLADDGVWFDSRAWLITANRP